MEIYKSNYVQKSKIINILSPKTIKILVIRWDSEASMKYLKCRLDIN